MYESLMTLLFPIGQMGYLRLFIAFFCWSNYFPFNMIHAKARKIDSQNPQEAANGYKNSDKTIFWVRRNSLISKIYLKDSLC